MTTGIPINPKAQFSYQGLKISYAELQYQVALTKRDFSHRAVETVLLQSPDPLTITIATLAAWSLEKKIILDPGALLKEQPGQITVKHLTDLKTTNQNFEKSYADVALNFPESAEVTFATSGSTGSAKLVDKSVMSLLTEVNFLKEIYKIDGPGTKILSLVGLGHIYGFLNGFVLPLVEGAEVEFIQGLELLNYKKPCDLLIMVPALWEGVKSFLSAATNKTCLVSSGAAFGPKLRSEVRPFLRQGLRGIEILGSTETGGIGYSDLMAEETVFQCFEAVRLYERDNTFYLESPFISSDQNPLALEDQFTLLDAGRFIYKGRVDRIFKYKGKRYSLSEIETVLAKVSQCENVRCHFEVDPQHIKGGVLIAWLEVGLRAKLNLEVLRQAFKQQTESPFPAEIYQLECFPFADNGKLPLKNLLGLRKKIDSLTES